MWLLLAVAAAGAVRVFTMPAAATVAPPAAPVVAPDIAAAGLAEVFVARWLAGDDLDDLGDLPTADEPVAVGATATVAMDTRGDRWTVTVAATTTPFDETVLDGDEGAVVAAPELLRFYRVAIIPGRRPRLAGLPAQVAAPRLVGGVVEAAWEPVDGLPADVAATLDGFATGLLSGSGSLDRYLTTNAAIRPVDPAPFADVEVTDVAVVSAGDDDAVVDVRVVGRDGDGRPVHQLEYRLKLIRGDRWEIAAFTD